MTNKEKIKKDIAVAFDFAENIVNDPDLLEKISNGVSVRFLDSGTVNPEKKDDRRKRKYVRVKNQFEML